MPFEIDKPLESITLSEKVYRLLLDQIVRGNLAPGEKLSIHILARELQVSRTPIKEAINRLAELGVLTIHNRKGTIVTRPESGKIEDLFEARLMIELWAAERVLLKRPELTLKKMDRLLKECAVLFSSTADFDYGTFLRHDHEFHLSIVDAPENLELRKMYQSLHAHMAIMRYYWGKARERAVESHHEHLKIFKALEKKNHSEASEALRAHILNSRNDVLSRLNFDTSVGLPIREANRPAVGV